MPAGGHSTEFASDTPVTEFDHCGWVPCIAGHLDFTLMRVSLAGEQNSLLENRHLQWLISALPSQDSVTDSFNFSYKSHPRRHHRRIAMQSWYNWRDQKTKKDGKFRVVVVAESNESSDPDNRVMQGYICIYPRAYAKSDVEAQRDGNRSILKLFGLMRKATLQYGEINPGNPDSSAIAALQNDLNVPWLALYSRLTNELPLGDSPQLNEVYRVKFRIQSNGLTYLSYQMSPHDKDRPEDHAFIVTRQAYYYIKYALHKHKHHNHDADALTTIVPNSPENKEFLGQILLLQLKRGLIYNKRINVTTLTQHNTNTEALGFIAYARSLLAACKQSNLIANERAQKELDNIDALERSYQANNTSYAQKRLHIESTKQTARQWATIVLAYISLSCLILINLFPLSRGQRALPTIDWLTSLSNKELLFLFSGGAVFIYFFVRANVWLKHPYNSGLAYYTKHFTKGWSIVSLFIIAALWYLLANRILI